MVWETVPAVLLLVVSGLMAGLCASVIWRTRALIIGSVPLVTLMAGVALWSWSMAAGLWNNNPSLDILARLFENAAIAIIPVAYLQFSLQYTGREPQSGTISQWLLLVIPAIMAALLVAALIVAGFMTGTPAPIDLSLPYGSTSMPVFWIYFAYGSFLFLTGLALIVQHYQSTSGVFRGQLACILIASVPPLFAYAGFVFQIHPFDIINLTPITGIISVVALAAGIEQFSLFDLVPVEYSAALRQIPAGIVLLDVAGRIIEINPAGRLLLGTADRDVMGFSISEILPPHELPPRHQPGTWGERLQTLKREQEGMIRYIELRCIPLASPVGKHHGYVIILTDITDQHLTDQSLAMARKKINFLTGITRHDILNQLTIIVMHNELLKEAIKDPSFAKSLNEQEKAASTIRRQIAFTKDYEKMGESLPQWLDIRAILLKHQEDLGHDYIIYGVQVEGLEVFGDPLMDRVFSNLLENSLRYGGKVTSIRLYHEQNEDGLTIIYQDNGVGIKKEDKEKIFQRGSGKRSGFGLFFSREILSLTGITIKETGDPGAGARFEINVPLGMFRFRKGNGYEAGTEPERSDTKP
jgi:PAS domain S-box-containing protein